MSWARGFAEHGYDPEPRPRPDWVADGSGTGGDLAARVQGWRALRRGMVLGAVIFACGVITGVACADTITIGKAGINGKAVRATTVSLEPSARPGELAVVTLVNEYVNQGSDDGSYALAMDGLVVEVRFTWDANPMIGADRIIVTPPQGVTCRPEDCTATVMEGFTGTVVLIDWRGM